MKFCIPMLRGSDPAKYIRIWIGRPVSSLLPLMLALALTIEMADAKSPQSELQFSPPAGWVLADYVSTDIREFSVYLPKGDRLDQWSEKIVIFRSAVMPDSLLRRIIDVKPSYMAKKCAAKPFFNKFGDFENGLSVVIACDERKKSYVPEGEDRRKSELVRIYGIWKNQRVYMVRHFWHSNEVSATEMLSDPAIRQRFEQAKRALEFLRK